MSQARFQVDETACSRFNNVILPWFYHGLEEWGGKSLYYVLYQFIGWIVFAFAFPVIYIYYLLKRSKRQSAGFGERLGFLEPIELREAGGPRIWIHAASVGEVQAARALVQQIMLHIPEPVIMVSVMTEQGLNVARQQFDGIAECFQAPLDLAGIVGRVFRVLRPSLYICLETELWPAIIRCVHRNGVPMLLLNGRLSEKSRRRYGMFSFLPRDLLPRFNRIAAIGLQDAERFIALGANPERIAVCGNVKYDLVPEEGWEDAGSHYRKRLGIAPDAPVLVAGSTHTGEEAQIIETFRIVRRQMPNLVLIVAPRHLRRLPELEAELAGLNVEYELFSRLRDGNRGQDVVVVDTMGELSRLYAAATYVFCGGSLAPRGGHNIMEAAVWSKPVFYGPSMKDFRDARELLETVGAGFLVNSASELADRILYFAARPDEYGEAARRAGEICREQRGAAARQGAIIVGVLAEKVGPLS